MATIGSLNYKIVADTTGFTRGIVATRTELRDAAKLFEATRTPAESLGQKLDYLRQLYEKGALSSETYQRSMAQVRAEHEALDPATQAAAASQAKLDAALAQSTTALQTQIATWGMSADETERWRLQQLGASDAAIAAVAALQAQRTALQAQADAAKLAAQEQTAAQAQQEAQARQLQASIDQVSAAIREQIETAGMSADEIIRWRLAQQGASAEALDGVAALQQEAAALREHEAAAADARRLQTEVERLSDALREEAATAGMSADEIQIWRLRQQGATDSTLEHVRALQRLRNQAQSTHGAHRDLGQSVLQVGQQHLGAVPGVSGLTDVLQAGHPVLIATAVAAGGIVLAYKALKAAADWYTSAVAGQLQAVDDLAVKARTLGSTVQDLRELREAGQQLGNVRPDAMDNALTKLSRTIADANAGGKAASATFGKLGLDAQQLSASGPAESMRQLADAFARVQDPAERVRLAVALFGREGADLVQVLAGGREAIDQTTAAFRQYAGVISATDVAAIEAQGDAWDRVQASIDGIAARAAGDLAPVLQVLAERVAEILDPQTTSGQSLRLALEAIPPVLSVVIDLGDVLIGQFQGAQVAVMELANVAVQAAAIADKSIAAMTPGVGENEALQAWAADYSRQIEVAAKDAQARIDRGLAGGAAKRVEKLQAEAAKQAAEADKQRGNAAIADQVEAQQALARETTAATVAIRQQQQAVKDWEQVANPAPAIADPFKIDVQPAVEGSTMLDDFDQFQRDQARLAESLRTPSERMAAELDRLQTLFESGRLDATTYARALAKTRDELAQPIVAKYEVDGVAAAVAGSQEAAAAIARHRREMATATADSQNKAAQAAATTAAGDKTPPVVNATQAAATTAASDKTRSVVNAAQAAQALETSKQAVLLDRIAKILAAIDANTRGEPVKIQEVTL